MLSYKNIVTQTIKVCKCLKYKKMKSKRLLLVKYINILLYLKEKYNFIVDFTSIFSCFRRPGSLFLPRVLNWFVSFTSNQRIVAALADTKSCDYSNSGRFSQSVDTWDCF